MWPTVSLGDICEFKYGKALPAKDRTGGPIVVYGSNGPVGIHSSALTGGPTIVIGRKGSFGEVRWSPGPCWPIDTTYFVDGASPKVDLSWLAHRLPALGLKNLNRAAAIPGLNREDAYRLQLLLPPLDEQRRIAAILDCVDGLAEHAAASTAIVAGMGRAIYRQTFGERHTEWPMRTLGDLIADSRLGLVRPASAQGSELAHAYIKMDAISGDGTILPEKFTRVDASPAECATTSAHDGDMLFNTRNTRELVGKSGVHRGRAALYNNNLMRLRFKDEVVADYVHAYLWSPAGVRQLDARKAGTTSVFAIYAKALATLEIPVPPRGLQDQFSRALAAVARTRADMNGRAAQLAKLHVSLQARAFSGQL